MNFSRFYIDRPIFAAVVSILIFMVGLVSMFILPITEYPEVTPPSVVVSASFPGASPADLAESVSIPLEEQINGVEKMLYMNSLSTTDGTLQLRITFEIGTDADLAQQWVQNRVQQALPRLPQTVRDYGVTVTKSSPDITMVVHIVSPNERYDALYLSNYANINIKDELAKIKGVGQIQVFGAGDYAMRLWLDPNKVAERGLTTSEVLSAVRRQNVQVAAGTIGGPPYNDGATATPLQVPVTVQGRLKNIEEFESIIVKRSENGVVTRLSDVARVDLGASGYSIRSLLDNKPAAAFGVFASPGANALDISHNVRAKMEELKQYFPEDVSYEVVYDPTKFVEYSIEKVIHTLLEAVLMVVIVVMVFLQRWRAALIPLLAVPVSIVGTFAVMYMLGFSINVLSLFGLILAIGIVVDDAIVVVENVSRGLEDGLTPRDAAIKAMSEVTGPIIATSLVLMSVFVPIAFLSGLTGMFYNQFSLTIAIAVLISTLNSLTLSPAMSAFLLQKEDAKRDRFQRIIDGTLGGFFNWFNRMFERFNVRYTKTVGGATSRKGLMMVLFAGLMGLTMLGFNSVQSGFVPQQDKQYLIAFTQLPPGSTLDQTEAVMRQMHELAVAQEGVAHTVTFPGLSVNGFVTSSSSGVMFLPLTDFSERKDPSLHAFALAGAVQQRFASIQGAFVAILPPPPVSGLGVSGGFKLQIEDRSGRGYEALNDTVNQVLMKANQHPALSSVYSNFSIASPQLYANLDRTKAEQLGIDVNEVFSTMQTFLGSQYINDFNMFGRVYRVMAQAEAEYRDEPSDIAALKVRNRDGAMIPLGSVMSIEESQGPSIAMRYNAYLAADINGNPAPGYSSGQAQDAITEILEETLPQGMAFEWTELTYQEILAGDSTLIVFPLCLFLVFLVLAAQYESLTLPIAVIATVPLSILSAIWGVKLSGGDNNIFTQISFFVLAGLASKNAILIVEFARELEHQGRSLISAAVEASRLRLRPILMTSFAFIMGVVPLVVSTGAGAEMRNDIGVAVFSGMLGVTFMGIIFTPIFYVLMRLIDKKFTKKESTDAAE